MGLVTGQTFTLVVKEIQNAADSFTKSTGEKSYCHYITLGDDTGELYPCQICDGYQQQNYCNKNDIVKVKIKSYTRGRYTLEGITVSNTGNLHTQHNEAKQDIPPKIAPMLSSPVNNPQLAGKASTIALNAAVSFYQNRPAPEENIDPSKAVLAMAEKFFNFIKSKE